jgi:hypothetical protein
MMNWKRMWKEAVVAYLKVPSLQSLGGTEGMSHISQSGYRCLCRYSNRAPPKYKSTATPTNFVWRSFGVTSCLHLQGWNYSSALKKMESLRSSEMPVNTNRLHGVRYRKIVRANECHGGLHSQIKRINMQVTKDPCLYLLIWPVTAHHATAREVFPTGGVCHARLTAVCLRNLLKMEWYMPTTLVTSIFPPILLGGGGG